MFLEDVEICYLRFVEIWSNQGLIVNQHVIHSALYLHCVPLNVPTAPHLYRH